MPQTQSKKPGGMGLNLGGMQAPREQPNNSAQLSIAIGNKIEEKPIGIRQEHEIDQIMAPRGQRPKASNGTTDEAAELFYEVIDFMSNAKKDGGRVFVHCVQGISRSTTMCLCYMIFTQKTTLENGLKYIRERRQIANPNMTFMAQLIWFHKRLFDTHDTIPVSPRVFLVSSNQPEDPFKISCRLLMDNLYLGEPSKKLDPRAMFIVQGSKSVPLYIWQGGNIPQGNISVYKNYAH